MTPATFRLLDGIADAFNPLLTVVGLAAPFIRRPRTLRSAILYYVSAGLAIGFVYVIRAVDIRYQIWALMDLDFSTHSAYATSLAVSLAAFQRRWLGPLLIVITLYFCLQLIMGYHSAGDILISATVAGAMALFFRFVAVLIVRDGSRSA